MLMAAGLSIGLGAIVIGLSLPRQIVLASNAASPRANAVSPLTRTGLLAANSGSAPRVVPAGPTEIQFTVGGNVTVTEKVGVVYANQHTGGSWDTITPPEDSLAELGMAYWWGNGLSAQPGDPSAGTSYIYGHSCAKWSGCAFNQLKRLVTRDHVTVTTPKGVLTYEVTTGPVPVPKAQLSSNVSVYRSEVNRLVLITCMTAGEAASSQHGVPSNWVVELKLVGSVPSS